MGSSEFHPLVEELSPSLEADEVFRQLSGLPHAMFLDSALRAPLLGRYSFVSADPFDYLEVPVEGTEGFAVPTTNAVVAGMNHYHFTDDASEEELAPGGDARAPMDVVRYRANYLVDAALDELSGGHVDTFTRPQDWPEGLRPAAEVLP